MNTMNTMNLFNLTFELEGREYSLNVNSEEEREKVKQEVNANSSAKYDWFKETTGKEHWVLYNCMKYLILEIVRQFICIIQKTVILLRYLQLT